MTIAMQPIYTQTATGSASAITFNSIPQTFTDLMVLASTRSVGAANDVAVFMRVNGDSSSSNYSTTRLIGFGTGAAYSDRITSVSYWNTATSVGANATALTFSNNQFYIPNYTLANFKSMIVDGVSENNATAAIAMFGADLWRNTAAITSVTIGDFGGNNFAANSTFTLYGITKG